MESNRILYNGIALPAVWPPKPCETSLDKPFDVPYLRTPPETIFIKQGRQLFVDDFLIQETTMTRRFHTPVQAQEPVFFPQTALEMNGGYCPLACPFKDGIFYDDTDKKFKMWYHAGWFDATAYAESEDGSHWNRVGGTACGVVPHSPTQLRDGGAVWIDYAAPPAEKYKMFVYYREFDAPIAYFHEIPARTCLAEYGVLYRSADGIHWEEMQKTGKCGDNTTFFYNPFTEKWVFSVRQMSALLGKMRVRGYIEMDRFFEESAWDTQDIRFWGRTDRLDAADKRLEYLPQLYNLDATPYESILLGMYSVFLGPPNEICEQQKMPKIIDLKLAYSRDGYHWDRPSHEAFLRSSRVAGDWNYGYLHPVNGLCLVVGEELYIYYTAFSGQSPKFGTHMYAGGSVGLAKLRRDGFASMDTVDGEGVLLTRPLVFEGSALYVNAQASTGTVRAEILDAQTGEVLPGFDVSSCVGVCSDETRQRITWESGAALEEHQNKRVQIRFLCKNAHLFSFWITPCASGASRGFMAGGGPGFKNGIDSL